MNQIAGIINMASVLGKLGRCGLLVVNNLERFSRFPIRLCGEEVLKSLPELIASSSKINTVEDNRSIISGIQNGQFNNVSTIEIIR